MFLKKKANYSTTRIIAIGFIVAIILGTILLSLPISTKDRSVTPWIDALFTATTSICVTGLTTVNTLEHWSIFGKGVILFLIQFGGLGVVTFSTTILLLIGKRITLHERLLIQDAYNLNTLRGLVKLTKKIIKGTLLVEGVGALFYMIQFVPEFGFLEGMGKAIFVSVSAFCNAGMDVIGHASLMPYRDNGLINIVTMTLIVTGGIGFPVWWDLLSTFKRTIKKDVKVKNIFRVLSLHTKIALSATAFLIIFGTVLIMIFEYNNPYTIGNLTNENKIMSSMFQSVTTRTAGFFTIPQQNFTDASSFLSLILMFIGGSPSGTAGGIKTVTIAITIFSAISILKNKKDVEAFKRKLSDFYIKKAITVIIINLFVLMCTIVALTIVEKGSFIDIVFESTSALATVGLSRDFTGSLSTLGKFIIVVTMYLGRIGPITMALSFSLKKSKGLRTLPEEKILVG